MISCAVQYKGYEILVDNDPLGMILVRMTDYPEGHYVNCMSMKEAWEVIDRFIHTGYWFPVH